MKAPKSIRILELYLKGFSAKEIAESVGTTPNYVHVVLSRMRKRGVLKPLPTVPSILSDLWRVHQLINLSIVDLKLRRGILGRLITIDELVLSIYRRMISLSLQLQAVDKEELRKHLMRVRTWIERSGLE